MYVLPNALWQVAYHLHVQAHSRNNPASYRHPELQLVLVDDLVLFRLQLVDVPVHGEIAAAQPRPTLLGQPGQEAAAEADVGS